MPPALGRRRADSPPQSSLGGHQTHRECAGSGMTQEPLRAAVVIPCGTGEPEQGALLLARRSRQNSEVRGDDTLSAFAKPTEASAATAATAAPPTAMGARKTGQRNRQDREEGARASPRTLQAPPVIRGPAQLPCRRVHSGCKRPGTWPRNHATRSSDSCQPCHLAPPPPMCRHPSANPVEVQVLSSA